MGKVNKNKSKKDNGNSVLTRETLGVVLILFATLCLVCLITRDVIFSVPGKYVNFFLFGVFGYFAFAVVGWVIFMGVLLVTDKKTGMSKKRKTLLVLTAIVLAFLAHVISMHSVKTSGYGNYLAKSFLMAEDGITACSGGGVITALLAYVITSLLTPVGSYIVLGLLLALMIYFVVMDFVKAKNKKPVTNEKFNSSFVNDAQPEQEISVFGQPVVQTKEYPIDGVFDKNTQKTQKLFVNNAEDFNFKTKRDIKHEEQTPGIKIDFADGGLGVSKSGKGYSQAYGSEMQQKINYIKTPAAINLDALNKTNAYQSPFANNQDYGTRVSAPISREEKPVETVKPVADAIPFFEHDAQKPAVKDDAAHRAEAFADRYAVVEEDKTTTYQAPEQVFYSVNKDAIEKAHQPQESVEQPKVEKDSEPAPTAIRDRNARRILFGTDGENKESVVNAQSENFKPSGVSENEELISKTNKEGFSVKPEESKERPSFTSRVNADNNSRRAFGFAESKNVKPQEPVVHVEEEKPVKEIPPINREYFRPPFDLLETYAPPKDRPKENHEERMEIIKQTLEDFHINAMPQSYVQGPSITRYEIMMPAGISVKKVLNYDDDLKMRLAARDGVRIEAPIPGKNLVGIEVANTQKITVGLKEVLEGMAGKKSKPGSLMFAIGKDIVGNPISDNLAKGPHYLVAGATGSGKSVCLNVMIVSLIMRYSPEELRLILVDPKRVEFRIYEHIPHLMIDEIINEPKKVLATLTWAYEEMERRYKIFEECGGMIVDIESYNENIASETVAKMPRIVIIIDELADLMETCKKDLESRIRALAQKARSAGIHLVLATQRPSVDIITGTIKANLPSRIALKVMNFNDSQTIFGEQGAEKLLGNGDMLYKNSTMPGYERYQGAWISTRETNNIVTYIKEHNKAYFDDDLKEYLEKAVHPRQEETAATDEEMSSENSENNEFFIKALGLAVNSGTISISMLQRRFQIGYARAGGLVDKMERMNYISGNEGSKARKVLITREEFEQKYGPVPD